MIRFSIASFARSSRARSSTSDHTLLSEVMAGAGERLGRSAAASIAGAAPAPSARRCGAAGRRRRSRAASAARRRSAGRSGPRRRSCRRRARGRRAAKVPIIPASTAADPAGRGEQVGDHADEEALDDDRQRDLRVEGRERRPEDADVAPPRSRSRRRPRARPREGSRTKAIAVADAGRRASPARSPGGAAIRPENRSCDAAETRRSRSPGISAISRKIDDHAAGDRRRDDRQPGRRRAREDAGRAAGSRRRPG